MFKNTPIKSKWMKKSNLKIYKRMRIGSEIFRIYFEFEYIFTIDTLNVF